MSEPTETQDLEIPVAESDQSARIARLERQVRGLTVIVAELMGILNALDGGASADNEQAGEEQIEEARARLRGRLAKGRA